MGTSRIPPATHEVNWVAAYALGLAFAVPPADAELRLRDATAGDPDVLMLAEDAVRSLVSSDPELRERAEQILRDAAEAALLARVVPA
jgi:hypothetical protein